MKKIMLLALAAVSAAVFALPAPAMALESLHLNPTPAGPNVIDSNGPATLSSSGSSLRVSCNGFSGSASFESGGTTGSMTLTFGGGCTTSLGGSCTSAGEPTGNIATTSLPFHLVTVGGEPGVLVTPGANNHFATFTCTVFGIPVKTEVKGNGVIGTITEPECGTSGDEATIVFSGSSGIQDHTTVDGTSTEYSLTKGSETAAQEAHGTLTLSDEAQLECT